ncbi:MAB_1171c family putative transporter [Streptomyces sp. bgisy154]|uniref:MAB_1171c family putative transporter n=1 Tax=Streptomyces sp. bgisy154 TaxID=3413794 RepID=UPI003D72EE66
MTAIRPFEAVLLVPMWSLTAYTARRCLRGGAGPESRPSRTLAAVVALVTLSVTVGVPAVRRVIDGATGVQSVTNLVGHLLGMSAITCLTAFVRQMSAPADVVTTRGRRPGEWLPLPVAAAALGTAFFLAPRPDGEQHLLTAASSPAHVAYWSVFLGYVTWGVTAIGVMCLRHRRQAPPGPLRTSLTLIGAGAATAAGYALHRWAYLALRGFGGPLFDDAVVVPTTQVLLTVTLLLSGTGFAWPALAERRRSRADRRALRRLEPLWRLLTGAVPEVVLPLPAPLRAEPALLLYRYTIEISDALLALDRFRDPGVEATARERLAALGFTGARLAAATEAVALRHAVGRTRAAQPAAPPADARPRPPRDTAGPGGDPSAWLGRVAVHCGHPVVRDLAASLPVPAGTARERDIPDSPPSPLRHRGTTAPQRTAEPQRTAADRNGP